MRLTRRAATLSFAALLAVPLPAHAVSTPTGSLSGQSAAVDTRLQPWLADQLRTTSATEQLRVMVSGDTLGAAKAAVAATGLTLQQSWDRAAVVVAFGTPAQVLAAVTQPGVSYVEGDQPLEYQLDTAHVATRSAEALATYAAPDGGPVDGAGVSVAVIDSGVDGTHPFFREDGKSKVVANLKNVCTVLTAAATMTDTCFREDPTGDSDTDSAGGHGTHVAGIVAGVPTTTTVPVAKQLRGAAPGAKLVSLSVGGGLSIINANAAMQWVVEHHRQPCKPATQQDGPADPSCPPIKVTNHSYGPASVPAGGHKFDPNSATVRIQRLLVADGVVPVWAAGNSGGNGSIATTNPPAMDPTPGVLMVGSYNDAGTGSRDNQMSTFSSRGAEADVTTFPDVSAPGDRITSSCRPYLTICSTGRNPISGPGVADVATFNTISGTSMATPYIAGVVAQLFQSNPTLTPADVEDILEDSAHKFTAGAPYVADAPDRNADDTTSFDKGHGLVDVVEALALVAARTGSTTTTEPVEECTPKGKGQGAGGCKKDKTTKG